MNPCTNRSNTGYIINLFMQMSVKMYIGERPTMNSGNKWNAQTWMLILVFSGKIVNSLCTVLAVNKITYFMAN